MAGSRHLPVVAALGTAQTLAWASTYYLPAMLAVPMAKDLGVSTPTVFAAFSIALIVSALLGPYAGRAIDRWGARPVLSGTNLVFALGLAALANAHGPAGLFGAWVVLGIGMGSGLYEAAFSALVRLYGRDSRNAITGITLIAGFASTIGWPLSSLLEHEVGWRGACYAWAAMHLLIGLSLALLLNSKINRSFQTIARGILIVPWLLAPTVAGMIWVLMLAPFGVVNAFLVAIGVQDPNANMAWLGDPSTSLLSVTAMNIWRATPFFLVMLLAGLQAIPQELYEAAQIDGATLRKQFWHITLPELRNIIATIVLLDSIWTFRAFDPVFIMTGGGPINSSEVLATAIYFDGFQKLKFGYASAEAVVMFVTLFIVSAIYVRRTMGNIS